MRRWLWFIAVRPFLATLTDFSKGATPVARLCENVSAKAPTFTGSSMTTTTALCATSNKCERDFRHCGFPRGFINTFDVPDFSSHTVLALKDGVVALQVLFSSARHFVTVVVVAAGSVASVLERVLDNLHEIADGSFRVCCVDDICFAFISPGPTIRGGCGNVSSASKIYPSAHNKCEASLRDCSEYQCMNVHEASCLKLDNSDNLQLPSEYPTEFLDSHCEES